MHGDNTPFIHDLTLEKMVTLISLNIYADIQEIRPKLNDC
jgi:hypothetical protein